MSSDRNDSRPGVPDVEDDYRDFFEHAAVGLLWVRPDGRVLKVNQAGLDMLGYSRQQYVGHLFSEFCVDPGITEELLFRLASRALVQQHEVRLRCRDESIKDVLISANGCWKNDEFVRARLVILDITGRKRWEMSQAELAAIVESSEDAIIIEALDGTVIGWNNSAVRLFGYTASQAIGEPVSFLIPPDRVTKESDILAMLQRNHHIRPFETVRQSKDGTRIHVSISASPIKDERGQIIGMAQIIRDISDIKQVEASLREKILDLEKFHDVVVGRELKLIQLETEIKQLKQQKGLKSAEASANAPSPVNAAYKAMIKL